MKRCGLAEHYRRVYLVAPRHPESFWSLQETVGLLGAKTLVPNSALATLVALTPSDVGVEFVLGDENVFAIDLDLPCDLVAITGATLHAPRIVELCSAFRERGIRVARGGTCATLLHDRCQGMPDHHFIGEAEHTWPRFLGDWIAGVAGPVYKQGVLGEETAGQTDFRSEREVRRLFWRNIARARYLDRGTRIRMFGLLAQYRHFRTFVTKPRSLPGRVGGWRGGP